MNSDWLILVISLPGPSKTSRMRIWRALKAGGAGILRDGVYVLPKSNPNKTLFQEQIDEAEAAGGTAYLLQQSGEIDGTEEDIETLFDRSVDYQNWLEKIAKFNGELEQLDESAARRRSAQLLRELESINKINFYGCGGEDEATAAFNQLEQAINLQFSPDEPSSLPGEIEIHNVGDYQNKTWATRKNMWVDRVASAWLIQNFIDKTAKFIWLKQPSACPAQAIGFDFDQAQFTHVENLVTFEVLLQSFGLDKDVALVKLGALVHYLDVGGVPVVEAPGFLTMLVGVKQKNSDDDEFLEQVGELLNHLYLGYQSDTGERE